MDPYNENDDDDDIIDITRMKMPPFAEVSSTTSQFTTPAPAPSSFLSATLYDEKENAVASSVDLNKEHILNGENLEDIDLMQHMKMARKLTVADRPDLDIAMKEMRKHLDEMCQKYDKIKKFVIDIFTYMVVAKSRPSVLNEFINDEDYYVNLAKAIETAMILARRNFDLIESSRED